MLLPSHREIQHWKLKLEEHQTYFVYINDPLDNDLLLKVCQNPFKIQFNGDTTVIKIYLP